MIVVVQRVRSATVSVNERRMGSIGRGLAVLAAIERGDHSQELCWMARKLVGLRVFPDESGLRALDRDVRQINGEILLVSNFTVAADCAKGRRPSLDPAASPETAEPLFAEFVSQVQGQGIHVQTGEFGADMAVEIENDGPVTLILKTPR